MDEYISRKAAIAYIREQSEECQKAFEEFGGESGIYADAYNDLAEDFYSIPAADVAPVVRCDDCINAEPLERNCELNANLYMHCRLWRGEECKNVWHKYKRYYRDYSLVEHDDFCSHGERKDGGEHVK